MPRNVVLEVQVKPKELEPHWYRRCKDYYGGHGDYPRRAAGHFGMRARHRVDDDDYRHTTPRKTVMAYLCSGFRMLHAGQHASTIQDSVERITPVTLAADWWRLAAPGA